MSDASNAVQMTIDANPSTLIINGVEMRAYMGPVDTNNPGDGSRESSRPFACISESPPELVGGDGEKWTVADFTDHGDGAFTGTLIAE